MKIFVITTFAAMVSNVMGFSVTMSSIGYLDNLSSGSISIPSYGNSAAPSPMPYGAPSPMPYGAPSPMSYSAPAPAPAPYRSPFADQPANSDLDYLKTLSGGGSMKSGRNFSGVSSYFRPVQGITYIETLKDKVMAPPSYSVGGAPAPVSSYSYGGSSTPAPAPAPSRPSRGLAGFGSYLDNL